MGISEFYNCQRWKIKITIGLESCFLFSSFIFVLGESTSSVFFVLGENTLFSVTDHHLFGGDVGTSDFHNWKRSMFGSCFPVIFCACWEHSIFPLCSLKTLYFPATVRHDHCFFSPLVSSRPIPALKSRLFGIPNPNLLRTSLHSVGLESRTFVLCTCKECRPKIVGFISISIYHVITSLSLPPLPLELDDEKISRISKIN